MKKTCITNVLFVLLVCFFVNYAEAELYDRGGGLIYDSYQNITWLTNANYTGSTMTWYEAVAWADSLVYRGYGDWRLPAADTSCSGYNCTESEMGYLYYAYGITSENPVSFTDVRPYMYWSGSEAAGDSSEAWRFGFNNGYQGTSSKDYTRYAWAVREGDSAPPVAPEPVSSVLFISGGAVLTSIHRRKNKH